MDKATEAAFDNAGRAIGRLRKAKNSTERRDHTAAALEGLLMVMRIVTEQTNGGSTVGAQFIRWCKTSPIQSTVVLIALAIIVNIDFVLSLVL